MPNSANAFIADSKLSGYLLNPTHRDNAGKARVFAACGCTLENPERLRDDLLELARTFDAILRRETQWGKEWSIIGTLNTPNGQRITIKTGW